MTSPISSQTTSSAARASLAIRPRERDAVLQALRTGVVPRAGQHLVQVGRNPEIQALANDLDRLADGSSSFRLVIGDYGAGKTFFMGLVRSMALEKKLVVASADLNPDRRLQATGGQARSLYAELMRSLSTRAKPDGSAMSGVVEKFVATAQHDAAERGISSQDVIREKLSELTEMVNGFDFAEVVSAYCRGAEEGNETLKNDAIRWLRGEFSTRTDARTALGVRTIVDDASVYDQLKLFARFVKLAGFSGFLICLDELVNLYKLSNTQARNANYEQILRILNDSLQGSSVGLGFILGGTPEFLLDTRRGLYSYPALQSRLAENSFARAGLIDYLGPVIKLAALTPEDFYVLLQKIRNVYALGDSSRYLLPDEGIEPFMQHCAQRIGNTYFRTPRTTIVAFVNLLAVLEQNPHADWKALIGATDVQPDSGAVNDTLLEEDSDDSELSSFTL